MNVINVADLSALTSKIQEKEMMKMRMYNVMNVQRNGANVGAANKSWASQNQHAGSKPSAGASAFEHELNNQVNSIAGSNEVKRNDSLSSTNKTLQPVQHTLQSREEKLRMILWNRFLRYNNLGQQTDPNIVLSQYGKEYEEYMTHNLRYAGASKGPMT